MPSRLSGMACLVLAAVFILVTAVEAFARPRDPFSQFMRGIEKAFTPQPVRKAYKFKRAPQVTKKAVPVTRQADHVSPTTGEASFYGDGEKLNTHTASGEVFNPLSDVCAHRRARFGTLIRVRNLDNGKTATCRVADRGPAQWTGRILDVSKGVAAQLGMLRSGVARVSIAVMELQ